MNVTLKAFAGRGMQSPNRIAIVAPDNLHAWKLESQSQLVIKRGRYNVTVWVYQGDVGTTVQPSEELPTDLNQVILLSKRSRDALSMSQPLDVRIIVPKSLRLNVVPALIDDLPSGEEAQVNEEICQIVCGWHDWTLIVHDGCSFPVRLQTRKMLSTNIRLSLLTRALICSAKSSEGLIDVQLTPLFDDRPSKIEPSPKPRSLFQRFFSVLPWMIQLFDRIAERLLRPLLGAPVVTLRTVGALVGDDNEQVIRLHSEVFPLIGVEPGDHVIVSWADRYVMAVALEAGEITPEEARTIKGLKRIDLFSESPEPSALDHLSIGVSAKLRSDLGIPRSTVLCVRRRLMTAVLGQLNQLTIPVLGLILAAVAVPNISYTAIAIGFIPMLILGMLPIRHKKPPHGRF